MIAMKVKLLAVVFLAAIVFSAEGARASSSASCEVLAIKASNSGKGIDPALNAYVAIFKQPPFASYNTFKLELKKAYVLNLGIQSPLVLPSPMGGQLRLNSISQGKLDLTLTLQRKDASPIIINGKASPGAPFFAAGLAGTDGVWIFGVVCANDGIVSP